MGLAKDFKFINVMTWRRCECNGVPFKFFRTSSQKNLVIAATAALELRNKVATDFAEGRFDKYRSPLDRNAAPSFGIMQEMWDAGMTRAPGTEMPVYNLERMDGETQRRLWELHCDIAELINKDAGQDHPLGEDGADELRRKLRSVHECLRATSVVESDVET